MTPKRKSQLIALGLTLLVHVVIVSSLLLIHLDQRQAPTQLKEVTLVPVGLIDDMYAAASGSASQAQSSYTELTPEVVESRPAVDQPRPSAKPKPIAPSPKPEASQAVQNDPSPIKATPDKAQAQQEAQRRQAEAKRQAEAEQRRRDISNKVSGAFSQSGNNKSNKGQGEAGIGGNARAGWSLNGRSIVGNGGAPVKPTNIPDIRGTVNVTIIVDRAGHVIDASVSLRGTNTTDRRLTQAALRAAKQTRFNNVSGLDNQQGTITYYFDVK